MNRQRINECTSSSVEHVGRGPAPQGPEAGAGAEPLVGVVGIACADWLGSGLTTRLVHGAHACPELVGRGRDGDQVAVAANRQNGEKAAETALKGKNREVSPLDSVAVRVIPAGEGERDGRLTLPCRVSVTRAHVKVNIA